MQGDNNERKKWLVEKKTSFWIYSTDKIPSFNYHLQHAANVSKFAPSSINILRNKGTNCSLCFCLDNSLLNEWRVLRQKYTYISLNQQNKGNIDRVLWHIRHLTHPI